MTLVPFQVILVGPGSTRGKGAAGPPPCVRDEDAGLGRRIRMLPTAAPRPPGPDCFELKMGGGSPEPADGKWAVFPTCRVTESSTQPDTGVGDSTEASQETHPLGIGILKSGSLCSPRMCRLEVWVAALNLIEAHHMLEAVKL